MASRYVCEDEPNTSTTGIDEYWSQPLVSLEKATNSLRSIWSDINALVSEARQNCIESPDGLTPDESAAIYLYTMDRGPKSVYRILNRTLRAGNKTDAQPWLLYLKLFATALKKLPLYTGSVWRGVHGDVAKRYQKSVDMRWWAFTSCSTSISILKRFIPDAGKDGTVFMIECVTGRNIAAYSAYGDENEILLLSGTPLVAADESLSVGDLRVVHLREVRVNAPPAPKSLKPVDYSPGSRLEVEKPARPHSAYEPLKPPKSAVPKSASASSTSIETILEDDGHVCILDLAPQNTTCPHCSTKLVLNSTYKPGKTVRCSACGRPFNELPCPHCGEMNVWKNGNYHAGRKVKCASCHGEFQHLNCPSCDKEAFWRSPNSHTPGLITTCRACQLDYRALNCPHCRETQYFKGDEYKAGLRCRCGSCNNAYQMINCPHCSELQVWSNADRKPGLVVTCHSCNGRFQHINCPECSEPCVWTKANRTPGYRITCHKCKHVYQHINCPHCQKPNVWSDGGYRERARVTCGQCNGKYQHVNCPRCEKPNFFCTADVKPGDRIKCCHCDHSF